jgi:hypothetical protein
MRVSTAGRFAGERPAVPFQFANSEVGVMPGRKIILAGISLMVVAGAGTLFSVNRDGDAPRMPAATQARSVIPTAELVEYRDDHAGFALSYPTAWVRATAPNPQIVLVAAEHDPAKNQGGSILVRVTPLDAPVGKAQLAEARKATDAMVASSDGVALKAEPTETEQGGLPGLYYLYTFRDPVSGLTGVHSHFFLFKDSSMISVVFQALPQDDFARLAPLFDRVAGSLRVLP